jgi:uncharacterized integral membrane protein
MRIRTVVLILSIVLVTGFAALNIDEFSRSTVLNMGFTTMEAPLGLVMLVLLASALLIFLAMVLFLQSAHLLEIRHHTREMRSQRDLADKAEASRFTELRQYLEEQALASQQRDDVLATKLLDATALNQQNVLAKIDSSGDTLAAYIGELEDRLEIRDGVNRPASTGDEAKS